MTLTKIVERVNYLLAGENLTYSELEVHLDSVIDDLNHELNSVFPAFSEFNNTDYGDTYPDYSFFPDRYIRSVVCVGAAFKFFITDEEGAQSAMKYEQDYAKALFMMQRDYSNQVPVAYQPTTDQGYLDSPTDLYEVGSDDVDTDNLHPDYYLNGEVF